MLKRKWFHISERDGNLRTSIFIISFVLIFISVSHQEKILDVSDVVSLDRQLINVRDTSLPLKRKGTSNVIIGINGMPRAINYMFSIAIAKFNMGIAIRDVLVANQLTDLGKYVYVLSSSNNNSYGAHGCHSYSNGSISIVDIDCIKQRQQP